MAVVISGGGRPPRKKPLGKGGMLLLAAVLATLIASAVLGLSGLKEYRQMRDMVLKWTEMTEVADEPDPERPDEYYVALPDGDGGFSVSSTQAAAAPEGDWLYRSINLRGLQEINADVTGYIYIPGTRVDYPILKEREPEQYFYINHDMQRAYDPYGSIFELCDEERGVPGLDNPIDWLFGHHMSSGAMFATLYSYEKPDFYDTPIYIYREGWRAEYEAFGFCYVDKNDAAYDFAAYGRGTEQYRLLLDHLKENNSMQKDKGWPDDDDDILIMSTCYGRAGTSRRMILLCREVRRAMVPDYYEHEWEVRQYGGDETPVDGNTIPGRHEEDDGPGGISVSAGITGG